MRLGIVFALISAVAWGQDIGYCVDSSCYCMIWADDGVSGMGCGGKPFIGQAQFKPNAQGFVAATRGPVPVELAELPDSIPMPMCRITVTIRGRKQHSECVEWNDSGAYMNLGFNGYRHEEQVDVPAIQDMSTCGEISDLYRQDGPPRLHCVDIVPWTCADKSRFLLKDEGGDYHCLKLSGREQ